MDSSEGMIGGPWALHKPHLNVLVQGIGNLFHGLEGDIDTPILDSGNRGLGFMHFFGQLALGKAFCLAQLPQGSGHLQALAFFLERLLQESVPYLTGALLLRLWRLLGFLGEAMGNDVAVSHHMEVEGPLDVRADFGAQLEQVWFQLLHPLVLIGHQEAVLLRFLQDPLAAWLCLSRAERLRIVQIHLSHPDSGYIQIPASFPYPNVSKYAIKIQRQDSHTLN